MYRVILEFTMWYCGRYPVFPGFVEAILENVLGIFKVHTGEPESSQYFALKYWGLAQFFSEGDTGDT